MSRISFRPDGVMYIAFVNDITIIADDHKSLVNKVSDYSRSNRVSNLCMYKCKMFNLLK